MEKNYKGDWVSRGITAVAYSRLTEGSAVLLMPTFKLQNTVRNVANFLRSCGRLTKHLQFQNSIFGEGWWKTLTTRRDNAFENGKLDFPRILAILNEGRPRKGWFIEMDGMLVPVHTGTGTE